MQLNIMVIAILILEYYLRQLSLFVGELLSECLRNFCPCGNPNAFFR